MKGRVMAGFRWQPDILPIQWANAVMMKKWARAMSLRCRLLLLEEVTTMQITNTFIVTPRSSAAMALSLSEFKIVVVGLGFISLLPFGLVCKSFIVNLGLYSKVELKFKYNHELKSNNLYDRILVFCLI